MHFEGKHRDKYTTEIRTSDGTARETKRDRRRDGKRETKRERNEFNSGAAVSQLSSIKDSVMLIHIAGSTKVWSNNAIIGYSIGCQLITFVTSKGGFTELQGLTNGTISIVVKSMTHIFFK